MGSSCNCYGDFIEKYWKELVMLLSVKQGKQLIELKYEEFQKVFDGEISKK